MTLLDQRIVAGIGNVYKSEVLFLSGVHPEVPSSAVPLPVLEAMMDIARGLLRDNVVEGTLAADPDLSQSSPVQRRIVEHDESLWVYGRRNKPCRKCATPIEMKKMGLDARSTYWCPNLPKTARRVAGGELSAESARCLAPTADSDGYLARHVGRRSVPGTDRRLFGVILSEVGKVCDHSA